MSEMPDAVKVMQNLAAALAAAADDDAVLACAAEAARAGLNARGATVYLHDPAERRLHFARAIGGRGTGRGSALALGLAGEDLADDEGIVGAAFQGREPVIVNHVASDTRHAERIDDMMEFDTVRAVAVPLIGLDGCPYGALQALNKRSGVFTDADAQVLQLIGIAVTLALSLRPQSEPT